MVLQVIHYPELLVPDLITIYNQPDLITIYNQHRNQQDQKGKKSIKDFDLKITLFSMAILRTAGVANTFCSFTLCIKASSSLDVSVTVSTTFSWVSPEVGKKSSSKFWWIT